MILGVTGYDWRPPRCSREFWVPKRERGSGILSPRHLNRSRPACRCTLLTVSYAMGQKGWATDPPPPGTQSAAGEPADPRPRCTPTERCSTSFTTGFEGRDDAPRWAKRSPTTRYGTWSTT